MRWPGLRLHGGSVVRAEEPDRQLAEALGRRDRLPKDAASVIGYPDHPAPSYLALFVVLRRAFVRCKCSTCCPARACSSRTCFAKKILSNDW